MSSFSFEILTGRSEELVLTSVVADLQRLKEEAKSEGFELAIASGFRSFERQLNIFNNKAKKGEELFSILRWSALPGASRHHWGTDFDLYETSKLAKDYKLKLISEEYEGQGPFALFSEWLDKKMQDQNFPFFRPYALDLGGVAPERWHLSHKLSEEFFLNYTLEIFERNIHDSPLELKSIIWEKREEIFKRFFKNISPSNV